MRRISTVLIVLALPAVAQTSQPYVVRDTVTSYINVRGDHDDAASSIACLVAGAPATVIGVVPY